MMDIRTLDDVRSFFRHLIEDRKVNFHPDDQFECYVEIGTENPTFTLEECHEYNAAMQKCFDICEAEGVEIYSIGFEEVMNNLLGT